jgi:hypothetical protein
MPVPWDGQQLALRLKGEGDRREPRENGITLVQLRSLQDFLKRLCKMGLLRHTSSFSKQEGTHGKAIGWTIINMHNISDEVVKKLIPEDKSCSWSQIVSKQIQRPKVYVSHNWSEPFRDFMKALELYQASTEVGIHDAFFICTFANNQWKVDLGRTLKTSPFYLALEVAQCVLLMLDKTGSALERVWCVFELKTVLEMEKPLRISTPLGVVGDRDMSTLQVMEVLKSVDIRKAQATNLVDHRQICNNIAGLPEEEGLTVNEHGKKFLVGEEKATGKVQNFKYEEELMSKHSERFVKVNTYIQSYADKGTKSTQASTTEGCVVADKACRALTLAQMRMMARKARNYFEAEERAEWRAQNNVEDWTQLTLIHIMNPFLKEYVALSKKDSYMECVADGPQKPEFMLTEAFQMKLADFMSALEWHAEARGLPASTTYWFLPTAMLREEADAFIQQQTLSPSAVGMPYYQGQLVILEESAQILTRALPCLEMLGIIQERRSIDLTCPSGALAVTRPFGEGWEFGRFDARIAKHLINFDITKISGNVVNGCDHAEMTKCRVAGIEYKNGMKAPEWCAKYEEFNKRLYEIALGPVLRTAVERMAALDDHSLLLRIIDRSKDVSLTSASLHGLHGETALHISAAAGLIQAIEILLQRKANPNQQDYDGETPLHYAATAGQLESVELLLSKGAVASVYSYFMETPAQVAHQNPAAFLGVQTDGVEELCGTSQPQGAGKRGSFFENLFCCKAPPPSRGSEVDLEKLIT